MIQQRTCTPRTQKVRASTTSERSWTAGTDRMEKIRQRISRRCVSFSANPQEFSALIFVSSGQDEEASSVSSARNDVVKFLSKGISVSPRSDRVLSFFWGIGLVFP